MKNETTEVALFGSQSTAVAQYVTAASEGFENVTQADIGLPFLNIIQKGSAEFDETHPDHGQKAIEGVKPGCVINTATRSIIYSPKGAPFHIIPCFYQKLFNEWKPKHLGGGLVKVHVNPSILQRCLRNEKGADILAEGDGVGNEIKTTMTFYVLAHTKETGLFHAILNLTGKGLAVGRKWLATAQTQRSPEGSPLPLFAMGYKAETIPQSNQKGSWFQWQITPAGMPQQQATIDMAREFYAEAKRQSLRITAPESGSNVESASGSDDAV